MLNTHFDKYGIERWTIAILYFISLHIHTSLTHNSPSQTPPAPPTPTPYIHTSHTLHPSIPHIHTLPTHLTPHTHTLPTHHHKHLLYHLHPLLTFTPNPHTSHPHTHTFPMPLTPLALTPHTFPTHLTPLALTSPHPSHPHPPYTHLHPKNVPPQVLHKVSLYLSTTLQQPKVGMTWDLLVEKGLVQDSTLELRDSRSDIHTGKLTLHHHTNTETEQQGQN